MRELVPTLRDYQIEAIDKIAQQHRVILGDQQGLGKTLTSLVSSMELMDVKREILVFCPDIALGTWCREAEKWFGEKGLIYSGRYDKRKRDEIWEQYQEEQPLLLACTYAMIDEILERKPNWQAIICDEYHKVGLKNHKSQTYKKFKKLRYRFLILSSGTPVSKGPHDLFAPLHLCNSYKFPAYWPFVNKYCIVLEDTFGKSIEPRPKDPQQFASVIRPHLIRRKKKDVLNELPDLQRQPIELEMTRKQEQLYNELMETDILETPKGTIACPNVATKLMRARQLLVTPRIFGFDEDGAAVSAAIEAVKDSFDQNMPVAVTTPFKPAVTEIAKALREQLKDADVYEIHGDIKEVPRNVADRFQDNPKTEKVLVFTVSSGMSFDAYSASNLYFVGAEWSAVDNEQAESRLHRMGQKNAVNAYYFLYPGTIDDGILERLDENTMAQNWTLEPEKMAEKLRSTRRNQ